MVRVWSAILGVMPGGRQACMWTAHLHVNMFRLQRHLHFPFQLRSGMFLQFLRPGVRTSCIGVKCAAQFGVAPRFCTMLLSGWLWAFCFNR